jgi:hypothetical protein
MASDDSRSGADAARSPDSPLHADVARCAADCAALLPRAPGSLAGDLPHFEQPFQELTDAVRRLDPRFAFDREGRPAALETVRSALPKIEREIFDAVLEDYACELAATQEAIYQIALARGRRIE